MKSKFIFVFLFFGSFVCCCHCCNFLCKFNLVLMNARLILYITGLYSLIQVSTLASFVCCCYCFNFLCKFKLVLMHHLLLYSFALLDEDCKVACGGRCKEASLHDRCLRACGTCCAKCNCVPPGTYGNKNLCPCYANMKTHGNKLKCPWLWYVEHYHTCWAVQLWNIVASI